MSGSLIAAEVLARLGDPPALELLSQRQLSERGLAALVFLGNGAALQILRSAQANLSPTDEHYDWNNREYFYVPNKDYERISNAIKAIEETAPNPTPAADG